MEINRKNFEAYLLDQMEGKLSARLQQELHDFLAVNPDCAMDFEPEESSILPREELLFPDKESLRKKIPDSRTTLTENNFDLFSIARMERDLSENQVKDHELMMKNQPQLNSEWDRWQQTRLKSDIISYPDKATLKKRLPASGKVRWITILSSAAAIALVVLLFMARERNNRMIASEESFSLPLIEKHKFDIPITPPLENPPFTPIAKTASEEQIWMSDTRETNGNEETEIEIAESKEPMDNGDLLSTRPLRAALAANTVPVPVDQGVYDRIRPLQLPATPVHMSGVSISSLAEMDLQEVVELYAEEKDFSLWTIANAGIKGINRITGADIALLAARDDDGEISGVQLKSKRLNITTPIEKEE